VQWWFNLAIPPSAILPVRDLQAKFGIPVAAQNQLEIYTTAVLLATVKPPNAPREASWSLIMDQLGQLSCKAYRYHCMNDIRCQIDH